MKVEGGAGLERIDWARPWMTPWRECGEPLAAEATRCGVVRALDAAAAAGGLTLRSGPLRFVDHAALPRGEPYEAFIDRTGCVPTRPNLHDFFNGLAWLRRPALKRRLNELQAEQLSAARKGAARGPVRDALTLFDENGALLYAPPKLVAALTARDWTGLFVGHRADWAQVRLELFGHALIEKLIRPRKPITAHVWVLENPGDVLADVDRHAAALAPRRMLRPDFSPLPVLGVPGWWPDNLAPAFYDDPLVFRVSR